MVLSFQGKTLWMFVGDLPLKLLQSAFWDELSKIRKNGVSSTGNDFMTTKDKLKEQELYCIFYAGLTNQDVVNIKVRQRNQKFTDAFRNIFETGYLDYYDWDNLCKFVEENDYIMTATKIV